jgi:phosphoheptose isomerase
MREYIDHTFKEGVRLRQECAEILHEPLLAAAELMATSLSEGGKVLACGNGGSAADAQHFAGELVNRFETDRPGLAAVALTHDASVMTSIANDISFEQVYARQVEALGRKGDLLLLISTSGASPNVLAAAETAATAGMPVIALTGRDGGALGSHPAVRVHINIPHASTPRVQEMHITCLHILCGIIDQTLFGATT